MCITTILNQIISNKELSRYNHILGYNLIEGFKVGTKYLI